MMEVPNNVNDNVNRGEDDFIRELLSQSTGGSNEDFRRQEENNLTLIEKKRKIDDIYSNGSWKDEDEYEVMKIKKIVRTHIFKYNKFCKGEGMAGLNSKRYKAGLWKAQLGQTHERADLTKVRGYVFEVMNLCGMGDDKKSLSTRTLWWKTYNEYILYEVRQLRGRMNYNIRKSCTEG